MKKLKIILLLCVTLLMGGCGIKASIEKISDAVVDLSEKAGNLIESINDVVYLVDSKVENNEITNELGKVLDDQLSMAIESIEDLLEQGGGYLLGEINGTIDNAFTNIAILVDQIKSGIIDESIPALIDQIGSQLTLQVNTIVMAAEEMLMYTFGNMHVFLDKTVNSLVIMLSAILFGIGMIIFIILLFRKYFNFKGSRLVGLILMIVYMAFFLVVILFPRVRANIIIGFDYGKEMALKELPPKVTGVLPETFVFGKNQRLYIYGRHLDKLKDIEIKLKQGDTDKFTIPKECLIVATSNRIVLSNFESTVGWIYPSHLVFREAVLASPQLSMMRVSEIENYTKAANNLVFSRNGLPGVNSSGSSSPSLPAPGGAVVVQPGLVHPSETHPGPPQPSSMHAAYVQPSAVANVRDLVRSRVSASDRMRLRSEAASSTIRSSLVNNYLSFEKDYFRTIYRLPEGDYGLHVYDSLLVESAQFFSVVYPPPPPPKPDIKPRNIYFSGGLNAVANEAITLDITFGLINPEEIAYPFDAVVTSSPASTQINLTVDQGAIAAASSGGQAVVRTRSFDLDDPGMYTFYVRADTDNRIDESNEANNSFSRSLYVDEQYYKVSLGSFVLKPLGDFRKLKDFRVIMRISVTGNSPYKCTKDIKVNGSSKSVPCSCSFNNVKAGQVVMMSAEVIGKIDFGFIKLDIPAGTINWNSNLSANPTGTSSTNEESIGRQTGGFELTGKMTIDKL